MAQKISNVDLAAANALLTAKNIAGFYRVFSAKGYDYPRLALGVVEENTVEGIVAVFFMTATVLRQGKIMSEALKTSVKEVMADGLSKALQKILEVNVEMDREISADEALLLHNTGFATLGLPPASWTLYAPFAILGEGLARDALWHGLLYTANTPTYAMYQVQSSLVSSMALCSLACTSGGKKALAETWIATMNAASVAVFEIMFRPVAAPFRDALSFNTIDFNRISIGSKADIPATARHLADLEVGPATAFNLRARIDVEWFWRDKLPSLPTHVGNDIRSDFQQHDKAGYTTRTIRELDSDADLNRETVILTYKSGRYYERVFDSTHRLTDTAADYQIGEPGLEHEIREENDLINNTVHSYVHASLDPTSRVISENYTLQIREGRGLPRISQTEVDLLAGVSHTWVHAAATLSSPVVWEGWTDFDKQGRQVLHQIDKISQRYHEYTYVASSSSKVIAEAWDLLDQTGRNVRHEVDRATGLTHDYIHQTPAADSKVIAESWDLVDKAGHFVDHEIDLISLMTFDTTHGTRDLASAVIAERWTRPGTKGTDTFEETIDGARRHLAFTLNDGSTGWADTVNGRVTEWHTERVTQAWSVLGMKANPLYNNLATVTLQPPTVPAEGIVTGVMKEWYAGPRDSGWYYETGSGVKYKMLSNGIMTDDSTLTNPWNGQNKYSLKTVAFDYKPLPVANGFNTVQFDQLHIVGSMQGEIAFA